MSRRTLASPKVWLPGAAAAVLLGLVLLFGPGPDSAAHTGHDEAVYEFTWNRGTTTRLTEYQFWHYNRYIKQRCVRFNHYTGDCDGWQDTGEWRERPQDSCAARPEWLVADVVNGAQTTPAAPSGATCNRHDSYLEGNVQWVFTTAGHRTVATGDTQESSEQRCYLPGSRIQGHTRSTNTGPPRGESVEYGSSSTRPSQYDSGGSRRCGWWSAGVPHDHTPETTSTTAGEEVTTTTEAGPGDWSGTCSYDFQVGQSYSQALPTNSDARVNGYSYSGAQPGGMSVSGSSSLTLSGRPTSNGNSLQVSRGTITASVSSGDPMTLACVFRVREGTTVTTQPQTTSGWSGPCYEELELGEYYGDREYPEIYLPFYLGSSIDDDHRYSGRRPRGILSGRGEGEAFLYGTALSHGSYRGKVVARVGRVRYETPCTIVVDPGSWNPEVCEFFLEVDRNYDLAMPRLVGPRVDRYSSGSLPPGLAREGNRVRGSPALEGTWAVSWTAVIDEVAYADLPRTTCTFYVVEATPPGWSGICDWTFTVGHSYTRILPVADGATVHIWSGDEPDGMRMRFRRVSGGWAQELSGTPTAEGLWAGTLRPSPRPDGVEDIDCSFEVLPGPDAIACSRTIPSDQIARVRESVGWRTDVPRTGAHRGVPGGDSYLITTGDPGVGGASPRIWPWWTSDEDLAVTDTTGCEWRMAAIISAARPLFPWFDNDLSDIRQVSPAMHRQWQAMSSDQRAAVEADGRRLMQRVGLGNPEDEKWLGGDCEPGDSVDVDCVWGLPFPGVWQWSLTIRYRSDQDFRERDLSIASGVTRFWRFADQAG